jgi:hypothetical protein
VIARARAFASSGNNPAWRSADAGNDDDGRSALHQNRHSDLPDDGQIRSIPNGAQAWK